MDQATETPTSTGGGRIVVIGGEKGGTGKTTFATHLAYMRAVSGRRVILIDADPQHSASQFCATRLAMGQFPDIPCMQLSVPIDAKNARENAANLAYMVKTIGERANEYEDVIVDTGGRNSYELQAAVSIADALYVPIEPGQYDVWTMPTLEKLMLKANSGLVAKIIPNKMPTLPNHAARLYAKLEKAVEDGGYDTAVLCKYWITSRDYFRLTPEYGATVFEDLSDEDKTSDLKACQEFFNVYCDIYQETAEEWRAGVARLLERVGAAA